MSIDATRWAWTAPVNNSSQRLVLLSLADRAGEEHTAWPSIDRLAKDTVLDKKTVQKVILELIGLNLIKDTGERAGPTKRVRVLKLVGVNGREESSSIREDSSSSKGVEPRVNAPKNGNIKRSQKRDNSQTENDPKNGILNDPKNGKQNLSQNLPFNLSQEHDWIPCIDQLKTKLKMAGYEKKLELIIGLPSFEFELSSFNSYFDGKTLSDSQKLHKFTAWIIDKFERYQKANPEYCHQSSLSIEHSNSGSPLVALPSKPKGLLGGNP